MKLKYLSYLLLFLLSGTKIYGSKIKDYSGTYLTIDSNSFRINMDGSRSRNIDSTRLILMENKTFRYEWEPMFGPRAHKTITTTGTWEIKRNKVVLHSKYQENEYRFFESHLPELGDSMVRVRVQTYDSLTGFFYLQYLAIKNDTSTFSKTLLYDQQYPYPSVYCEFKTNKVDEIIFYGDFGRMPIIKPKEKQSNYFVLQYNLSIDWDYQYFNGFKIRKKKNKMIMKDRNKTVTLIKT